MLNKSITTYVLHVRNFYVFAFIYAICNLIFANGNLSSYPNLYKHTIDGFYGVWLNSFPEGKSRGLCLVQLCTKYS